MIMGLFKVYQKMAVFREIKYISFLGDNLSVSLQLITFCHSLPSYYLEGPI